MIQEYDIVIARKALGQNVKPGTKGTVLMIYNSLPVEYEIEFVDKNNNSLEVLTVNSSDVEKIDHSI